MGSFFGCPQQLNAIKKDLDTSLETHPNWSMLNPEHIWGYHYLCYCKLRLVTPHGGAEGTKIFDFDNPRLLEKALLGKELH